MLKLYNKSTSMQRFMAFIVDGIILSSFVVGLSWIIFLITGFNYSAYQAARNEFLTNYVMYYLYGGSYEQSYKLALNEAYKYAIVYYSIMDSFYLLGAILYLVILPTYWNKQTVGRMIMKIKVIGRSGDVKTGVKRTIIREIVGTWFIYIVLSSVFSGFIIVISAIMILISGRGIVDRISGTDLVQELPVDIDPNSFERANRFDREEANQFKPNPNDFRREDSIDAEVKDLDDKNDNSDDDGYQIF